MFKKIIFIMMLFQVALASDLDVQNDWFYAGIHHPAEKMTVYEMDENGHKIQKITTTFNRFGYITEVIYDDSLIQHYEPYINGHRDIEFIYTINHTEHTSIIKTEWLAPDHLRFDDGDLIIDTYFDAFGHITKQNLFLDHPLIPYESLKYTYLTHDQIQPNGTENDVFITILETDNFGSWTKQKEENINKKTIIRTRTIEYQP